MKKQPLSPQIARELLESGLITVQDYERMTKTKLKRNNGVLGNSSVYFKR